MNILETFLKFKQTSKSNPAPNLYKAITAELPKDRSKKQSKKATSIRKGGRATPGEPVMNYIETEIDEDEE